MFAIKTTTKFPSLMLLLLTSHSVVFHCFHFISNSNKHAIIVWLAVGHDRYYGWGRSRSDSFLLQQPKYTKDKGINKVGIIPKYSLGVAIFCSVGLIFSNTCKSRNASESFRWSICNVNPRDDIFSDIEFHSLTLQMIDTKTTVYLLF